MSDSTKNFPAEVKEWKDSVSGRTILQLTDYPCYHNKLYITVDSWTPDEKNLIFLSQRDSAVWNLYKMDMENFRVNALTAETEHINPYNPVIAPNGKEVWYHSAGEEIKAVDISSGTIRLIVRIPEKNWQSTIGTGPGRVALQCRLRWQEEILQPDNMKNYKSFGSLVEIMADGSAEPRTIFEEHFQLGHTLRPNKNGVIVYCKYDQGELWRINCDGTEKRKLYGNFHDHWITHPVWLNEREVAFNEWPQAVRKVDLSGKVTTIANLNAFHLAVSPDGKKLVCDTLNPNRGLFIIDSENGDCKFLCRDENQPIGGEQWKESRPYPVTHHYPWHVPSTHTHPSFNRSGSRVLFNSNRGTQFMQLCLVNL